MTPAPRLGWAAVALLAGCLPFHSGTLPAAPADAQYLTLRGTTIHYIDEGPRDAPTVVLVHGFASSLGVWAGVRQALRDDYRVLALDLKGFGWSDRPEGGPSDYSPEEEARILLAFLEARQVSSAAMVAHSWGSSIVLQAALLEPERVERIVLYDAWVFAEQLPAAFFWARAPGLGEYAFASFYTERTEDKIALAFFDPEVIPQALVDATEEQVRRPGSAAAALAAVRGMDFEEVERSYADIDKPTLLLWGREDSVTPLRFGEELVNMLPDARLRVYARCGHFPMIEAARTSTRDLVAFLDARPDPDVHDARPVTQPPESRAFEAAAEQASDEVQHDPEVEDDTLREDIEENAP